jgi:hypothetical protein
VLRESEEVIIRTVAVMHEHARKVFDTVRWFSRGRVAFSAGSLLRFREIPAAARPRKSRLARMSTILARTPSVRSFQPASR